MTMEEAPDLSPEPPVLSLSLAEVVASRVQIKGIFLVESLIKRAHQVSLNEEGAVLTHVLADAEFGINRETSSFHVQLKFLLAPTKDGVIEESPRLFISAAFVLLYSLDSFEGIDESHIQSFAGINAPHNAWPYWREYVQSSTARMSIPSVIAPVHRI